MDQTDCRLTMEVNDSVLGQACGQAEPFLSHVAVQRRGQTEHTSSIPGSHAGLPGGRGAFLALKG
jgi:hypothetical protein